MKACSREKSAEMLHIHRRKGAQISNEFIVLLGILIIITTVFLYNFREDAMFLSQKKERIVIDDLGYSIQNEFLMAQTVNDGYYREFKVPEEYHSVPYDISIQGDLLLLVSHKSGFEHSFLIPNVTGSIIKGTNRINKSGGVIYLN